MRIKDSTIIQRVSAETWHEVTTGTLWQQSIGDGDAYKKRSQTPPSCIAFQIKAAH